LGTGNIKGDEMGGIIGFRKVGDEDNISFEISRLVYAEDIRKNGTAHVMIEGMVTAGQTSEPFNTIELMIPHNSVLNIEDKTETFLDKNIKENLYRSEYSLVDKNKKIVLLSGIKVKIVPIDLRVEEREGYTSIFINFRSPIRKGETKVFRIIYDIKNFALKIRSNKYGYENFIIDIGFYDRSMIEHGNIDNSKIVSCKRIHVWIAFPYDFEILDTSHYQTKRKWDEYFLSGGKKDNYSKILLSWKFDEFRPWNFTRRLLLRLRRNFLGIIDLLGVIGFAVSVILAGIELFLLFGGG